MPDGPGRPRLSIVVPVFRGEQSVTELVERIQRLSGGWTGGTELIMVEDCGPDDSWRVLKELKARYPDLLRIVRLQRNSGQHNAILCGFSLVRGEIVVTMDDDLQNPPEEIPKLVGRIGEGYDLVIGAYDGKRHSLVRNMSGDLVDRIIRMIFRLPGDFQLTSFRAVRRSVVDNVNQMGGVYPYVTTMLLAHTSKCANVPVRHEPRRHGGSNYTLRRSALLAANLILSYSPLPVLAVGALAFAAFVLSLLFAVFVLLRVLFWGSSVQGWASTVLVVSFFNAVNLLCFFIFSLYLSRMNQTLTRSRVGFTIAELHES
jgi:polyisoprenyl-phosphate glycosyltransferase